MWDIKFASLAEAVIKDKFHLNNVGYKVLYSARNHNKTHSFHLNNVGYKDSGIIHCKLTHHMFHLNNVGYKEN